METVETLNWDLAIHQAKEELATLKNLEIIFGLTLSIATREVILEEALKMYGSGDRTPELFELLLCPLK